MQLKYKVKLKESERKSLLSLVNTGKEKAKKILHARIILLSDCSGAGPALNAKRIAEDLHIHKKTVLRVRERFSSQGLETAINRKPHKAYKPRKLDGNQEARLIALCCSQSPEGRKSWTLTLLADQLVQLNVTDSISRSTIQRTLKKTNLNLGKNKNGASQP